jgi:hypothetical protein
MMMMRTMTIAKRIKAIRVARRKDQDWDWDRD